MVILNFYGKLPTPICISQKLKIFISNLPKEEHNNWNEYLIENMLIEIKERAISEEFYKNVPAGSFKPYDLQRICEQQFPWEKVPQNATEQEYLQIIADNLICIYFDYEYEDMPFFDWTTNCFDGRLCEEDYAEKFMDFCHFIIRNSEEYETEIDTNFPSYIYSSNDDLKRHFTLGRLQLKCFYNKEDYIASLQAWGKRFDNFLSSPNDFYQLDYLINAIHKDREYNAYHFLKTFSLCEMLLLSNCEECQTKDVDNKLSYFIQDDYSDEEKCSLAKYIRQIRNKIGHGDFLKFNELLERVGNEILDNHYAYDYTEFSRQNWIIQSLCCIIDDALAKIIYLYIIDKNHTF